jgi:hypothetical protein
MLKELFDQVTKNAVQSAMPQIATWNPYQPFSYRNPDGTTTFKDPLPAVRKHELRSIDDIAQFAHDHKAGNGLCFYARNKIVYYIEDGKRLDLATVPLECSPPMLELMRLEEKAGAKIDQRALIWALRTVFKDRLQDAAKIITAIRNVKFDSDMSKQQEIQRGKASIGTSIQKQFVGLQELPEYITFRVPVWEGPIEHIADVECILDPDEQTGNFLLQPLPGVIEDVFTKAEQELGRRLAIALGEGYFLYNGMP